MKYWNVEVNGSFRELGMVFAESVWASGTPWPGSGGYETGTDSADEERAVCQPLLKPDRQVEVRLDVMF